MTAVQLYDVCLETVAVSKRQEAETLVAESKMLRYLIASDQNRQDGFSLRQSEMKLEK